MQDGLTRAEKYKLLVPTLRRAAEHIIGSVATALGLFLLAFSAPAAATDFGQSSGLTDAGNTYKFYSRESASVSPTGQGMLDPMAWAISCKTDAMTDRRSCNVMDSGVLIMLTGGGQVDRLCVVDHDFPGMKPMIRIGAYPPILLPEHACAIGAQAAALIAKFQVGPY